MLYDTLYMPACMYRYTIKYVIITCLYITNAGINKLLEELLRYALYTLSDNYTCTVHIHTGTTTCTYAIHNQVPSQDWVMNVR